MSYKTYLLFMWHFTLCLAGNNVSIIQSSTNWHEAFKHCAEQNSRLADISDVEENKSCYTIYKGNAYKRFWTGNFYKLSDKLSIEGCYDIAQTTIGHAEDGYKLLHDCFKQCVGRTNSSGIFAHRPKLDHNNCICDMHIANSQTKKECSRTVPLWWVYKVDSNDAHTDHETCHQLTCLSSTVRNINFMKDLCGLNPNADYHDLRTPVAWDKLPYICENNAVNITSFNTTTLPVYFRFGLHASLKTEPKEDTAITFKCKVIDCYNSFSFNVSLVNCSSTTSGFLCLKDADKSTKSGNISSTIGLLPETTSTVSKSLLTSPEEFLPYESTSLHTTVGTITTLTQSKSQQQTSEVQFLSSADNITNVQVVITSPVHTSAKLKFETTRQQIAPSKKSSYTFTSSHVTSLNEINVLESTTGISATQSESHSRLGLILGSLFAAIVVIVAIVVLFICRIRHLGQFRKKGFADQRQLSDSIHQDSGDTSFRSSRDVHNTMYDIHTANGDNIQFGLVDIATINENNIQNNEYAIVIKNKPSGNHVIEQNCDTSGGHSDDLLDSEYDRLNHGRPCSNNDSSNPYDSALGFREECDATYNTTDYRRIDKGDDSVYDHT